MKQLIILGVSGSIGRQTVKIVHENPTKFTIIGVSVLNSITYLHELLEQYKSIKYACVGDQENADNLARKYPNVTFFSGDKGLLQLVSIPEEGLVVNALVGFVGFQPTLRAIQEHKNVALANKESLVCGGDLIRSELTKNKVQLFPIDSEHSALHQCLVGEDIKNIRRLIITGSGGPFRDMKLEELDSVTLEQALHHPNWQMGAKITIDSATLVNKGFEVIEAHHLFGIDYSKIAVIMHYESVIHGLVEFNDGSIKASMGVPSMEIPILYAINDCKHTIGSTANFDFSKHFNLRFKPFDFNRFEALAIAYDVGIKGGTLPTVFNASNEIAVDAFLNSRIHFNQILHVIRTTIQSHSNIINPTLEDIILADAWSRRVAKQTILDIEED